MRIDGDTRRIWFGDQGSDNLFEGWFGEGWEWYSGRWPWPGGGYPATMTRRRPA
jgi:hypothetical protein